MTRASIYAALAFVLAAGSAAPVFAADSPYEEGGPIPQYSSNRVPAPAQWDRSPYEEGAGGVPQYTSNRAAQPTAQWDRSPYEEGAGGVAQYRTMKTAPQTVQGALSR